MKMNKIHWIVTFFSLTGMIILMISKGNHKDVILILLEVLLIGCWLLVLYVMISTWKKERPIYYYKVTIMSRPKESEHHGPCIRVMIMKGNDTLDRTIFKKHDPDIFDQLDYAAYHSTHFPFTTNITVKARNILKHSYIN